MRHIGIFYLSHRQYDAPLPMDRRRSLVRYGAYGRVYIRVQEVDGDSLSDALAAATPESDETVLNAKYLDHDRTREDEGR